MSQGPRVAVSWSAGKDSCLSLHRALTSGYQPKCLLNMVNRNAGRAMSHGLDPEIIVAQARALRIPLVQMETTWETYEHDFKAAIRELKQSGTDGVVFGDIDIEEHRSWAVRVCEEIDVTPLLPLWQAEPRGLLHEFVQAGFEAIVVSARAELFGDEWLGRPLNGNFVEELCGLAAASGFHPCGEQGEYHTFVVDGPIFNERIKVADTGELLREGYRFLDIKGYRIEAK